MSSPYNIGPILTPKSKLLTLFMFLRETTKFSMWDNRKAYLLLKFNGVVRIIHIEHGHISTCLYRLVSQHTHAKIYINIICMFAFFAFHQQRENDTIFDDDTFILVFLLQTYLICFKSLFYISLISDSVLTTTYSTFYMSLNLYIIPILIFSN